jgi:hypothetical protein
MELDMGLDLDLDWKAQWPRGDRCGLHSTKLVLCWFGLTLKKDMVIPVF